MAKGHVEIAELEKVQEAVGREIRIVNKEYLDRLHGLITRLEENLDRADGLYTAEQLAQKFLGGQRSPETVKRWCREEGLPHHRKNGLWLIRLSDFEEWVQSG